jgi:formate/nitrite transporter FocA (FNT family)
LKMKSLRSSPRAAVTKKKMNLIITVIFSVFLIFLIVNIVYSIIFMLVVYGFSDLFTQDMNYKISIAMYVRAVRNLSEIVQFSCNPYIYFLISRIFRC